MIVRTTAAATAARATAVGIRGTLIRSRARGRYAGIVLTNMMRTATGCPIDLKDETEESRDAELVFG